VGSGLDGAQQASWARAQRQLIEELQTCLSECHTSVKLPIDKLDVERGRKHVENVTVAWKRCATNAAQQLVFIEKVTK